MERRLLRVVTLTLVAACTSEPGGTLPDLPVGVEAISLLGDTLRAIPAAPTVDSMRQHDLELARAAYQNAPDNADSIIWLGRRLAYLGRYRDAIETFTEGIDKHPDDARMFRHRGHRYITLRLLDQAETDFERAAQLIEGRQDEMEPDGQPNAQNIPRSTLQSNIWYHLGLTRVLKNDLAGAAEAYTRGMEVSKNDDMLVATSYWYYMTLARLGKTEDASVILGRITPEMDVIENGSYQRLLLLFKGELDVASVTDVSQESDTPLANATVGYGVGQWHNLNGRDSEAHEMWIRTVAGEQWAAFGYIAAEAELARETGEAS